MNFQACNPETTNSSSMHPDSRRQQKTIRLEVAQPLAIDLHLSLESRKEVVEVSTLPEVLHTDKASVGEVVELAGVGTDDRQLYRNVDWPTPFSSDVHHCSMCCAGACGSKSVTVKRSPTPPRPVLPFAGK